MGKINKPLCATEYGNTGFGDCFLEPGKFVGAFQVPKEFEITEDDITDLQAFLQSKISAGIGARIYPYHNFITLTDGTEDVTINTTDYGTRIPVRDGYYDWTFRYLVGGVQLHQEIAKNAGTSKYFLYYDDNGVLYGLRAGKVLKGIPTAIFYVAPWRLNTGADTALYTVRMTTNPIYLNKGNLGFVKVDDFNLFDIQGLQTVTLSLEDLVANVAHVSAQTEITGIDMYAAYSAVLAVPAAWIATNKQDGSNITISGVTANAGNNQWYITFGTGFNTLDAGDKLGLKWIAPATLANTPYNIDGFESNELIITIPGS